ncbi:hypothetical protein [Desmospora activa]|uniref:Uncharacterized protein n=1 Tax=Desmospora activa DSM 45169 TaxID=1121389 RepID=A0A2T4ZDK5_9BACL|nr:hypothetical protein [Desmospora activa]PTM59973.1 hypothetical protein C8J48_2612 [Desmospora activa DSM 45169]
MRGNNSHWMEMEFRGYYGHIIYLHCIKDSKPILRAKILGQSYHHWEIYLETTWDVDGRSVRGWTFFESEFRKTWAIKKAKRIMKDYLDHGCSTWSPPSPHRSFPLTRLRS